MHARAAVASRYPFRIDIGIGSRLAEQLLALPALNGIYRRIRQRPTGQSSFVEQALAELGVELSVSAEDLARIPPRDPLVVVANHPFGAADGLCLAALVRRVRHDVKILANRFLSAVPELHDVMLPVEVLGDAEVDNAAAMRAAVRWVRNGGALCIFPAGEVSHLRLHAATVTDGPWNTSAARIAAMTGAAVLPVFFEGRNSALFQMAGLVHPRLRTALLPRELLKLRGSRINVHVGTAISRDRLGRFTDSLETTDYLRLRSYVLMGREKPMRKSNRVGLSTVSPLVPPGDVQAMAAEVAALQPLVRSHGLAVYVTPAGNIPKTLLEIGRLREITFRMVGEGTGKSLDLDRFDPHYHHLFVWNGRRNEVVGAYRLGLTDELLPRFGPAGLYTNTLFHFRGSLLEQISPAVELGRSFVRAEYQKEYAPLMLLWKGIGHFVAQNPRYRHLIGPVSISSNYTSLTRQILMSFLHCNTRLASLAKLIVPRNPPASGPPRDVAAAVGGHAVSSIAEVDELVAEIEQDRHRVPVLLRQYLKLGAKLLGFNVDPEFGDVLDGLMLVDLLVVDRVILGRYMGAENLAAFHAHHRRA
jgi:putative hemolysin